MSNWYGKKYAIVKRILCVLLAAIMVLSNMYVQNGSQVYASTPDTQTTTFGGTVIRGVVDEISDLPHGGEDNNNIEAARGTVRHPFVVLEIVGYKEQAEIGYLIGGCEPIRVEELFGTSVLRATGGNSVSGLGTALVENTARGDIYFFADENEGDIAYYDTMSSEEYAERQVPDTETKVVKGYWEKVDVSGINNGLFETEADERLGTHKMVADAETRIVSMEADEVDGDFVWHTINEIEIENNRREYGSIDFNNVLDISKTYSVGDRIYTTRSTSNGVLYDMGGAYVYYNNNEIFLRESLGLTEKEAVGYSVVVKTITTEELNSTPEWVDYADLIYINPVSKNANIAKFAKTQVGTKYINRLGMTSEDFTADADYKPNVFEYNDLDFSVVRRIFYKVSAEENFAALLMDSDLYNLGASYSTFYTSESKKEGLSVDVYDWNLNRVMAPSIPTEASSEASEASSELTASAAEDELVSSEELILMADASDANDLPFFLMEETMSQSANTYLAGSGVTYELNASDLNLSKGSYNTDVTSGKFVILGTDGKFDITDANVEFDGVTYTKSIKLSKTVAADRQRKISFTTSGAATIEVICSAGGSRTLQLSTISNDSLTAVSNTTYNSKNSLAKCELNVSGAGTYYFHATNNDINIYYIKVTENGSDSGDTPPTTAPSTSLVDEK